MAEFVRIWDKSNQKYIEYDISSVDVEIITTPVIPVSISRDVNVGVVQKIININDINVKRQSVEISQIFRPITVDRLSSSAFSIQTSPANPINIDSNRSEISIVTSTVGQRGIKGDDGEDSIIRFNPGIRYSEGDLVTSESSTWVARVELSGALDPLDIPAENDEWTELANHQYVESLPTTSAYEISSQEDFDALEGDLQLGDLIHPTTDITLLTVRVDIPFVVLPDLSPLTDEDGNVYSIVSLGNAGSYFEADGTRTFRTTLTMQAQSADGTLNTTGNAIKLNAALRSADVIYGQDSSQSGDSPGDFDNASLVYNQDGDPFKISTRPADSGGGKVVMTIYGQVITGGPNDGETDTGLAVGDTIFGAISPGVRVEGIGLGFVPGNELIREPAIPGDPEIIYEILRIAEFDSIEEKSTSFTVVGIEDFSEGENIFVRTSNDPIGLLSGGWYVLNNDLNRDRLDSVGLSFEQRNTLDTLIPNVITSVSNLDNTEVMSLLDSCLLMTTRQYQPQLK